MTTNDQILKTIETMQSMASTIMIESEKLKRQIIEGRENIGRVVNRDLSKAVTNRNKRIKIVPTTAVKG